MKGVAVVVVLVFVGLLVFQQGRNYERHVLADRLVPEYTLGGGQWCTADQGKQWVYDTGRGGTALNLGWPREGLPLMGVATAADRLPLAVEGDTTIVSVDRRGYVRAVCMPSEK